MSDTREITTRISDTKLKLSSRWNRDVRLEGEDGPVVGKVTRVQTDDQGTKVTVELSEEMLLATNIAGLVLDSVGEARTAAPINLYMPPFRVTDLKWVDIEFELAPVDA